MKCYYGWAIVAVGFLAFFAGSIPSMAFGLPVKPMSEDLDWSRSSIIAGNTVGTRTTPLIGYLLDCWGARAVMVVSAIVGGAGLIATAWVTVWKICSNKAMLVTFRGRRVLVRNSISSMSDRTTA